MTAFYLGKLDPIIKQTFSIRAVILYLELMQVIKLQ